MPEAAIPNGVLLAFDFGFRRIGVATGQTVTGTASSLEVVRSPEGRVPWETFERLVAEWRPAALVVGLPLHTDDSESEMTKAARAFGDELASRTGVPVHYVDERYTSQAAQSDFAELRREGALRRRDRKHLDAAAARRILETFLNDG